MKIPTKRLKNKDTISTCVKLIKRMRAITSSETQGMPLVWYINRKLGCFTVFGLSIHTFLVFRLKYYQYIRMELTLENNTQII